LPAWIAAHQLDVLPPASWRDGQRWVFRVCPWNPDHRNHSAYIVQFAGGPIAAGCHHNGCQGKDWRALRTLYDPAAPAAPAARSESTAPDAGRGWTRLDTVQAQPVKWLWPRRIPQGKLVVVEGDPGLGKSTITLDLTARITTHRAMPDGTPNGLAGPADVLLLSAEDGLADTIKPKLVAMGADLTRVHQWEGVPEGDALRPPALPADLDALAHKVEATGAAVVILDPLTAYLAGSVDVYKDHHIRRALAPLAVLAERLGVTFIVLRHLVKSPTSDNPLHRGGGSVAIGAAARVVLVVAPDPDDHNHARRILAVSKNNLAAIPPSLAFTLSGHDDQPAIVQWEGKSEHTARTLLALNADEKTDTRLALDEAVEFLRQTLASGRRLATDVQQDAEAQGITLATLRRAKKTLGVEAKHEGYGPKVQWYWQLPVSPLVPS
jgi:hypothetical protein